MPGKHSRARRWSTSGAWALFAALLCAPGAPAQTVEPGGLVVNHFGLEDGLPGLSISNIATTDDGMMWLNVSNMLVSFDGEDFETHELARFPARGLRLVHVDAGRADTVLVVLDRQLFTYTRGRASLRAELETDTRNVWQDDQGVLWAWDRLGAIRIDDDGFTRVLRLAPLDEVQAAEAGADDAPDLWIHPSEAAATRRINAGQVLDPLPFPDAWPIPDHRKRTLLSRPLGTSTEVSYLDGSPVTSIPAEAGTWPLLLDRRGLLWTQRPGRVSAIDAAGNVTASLPLAPGAQVTTAVEDSEGNVWFGTLTDGLYRVRPRVVRVMGASDGLTDGQVLKVSSGEPGSLLILTHPGSVLRLDENGIDTIFESSPSDGRATSALVDRRGTVWVAVVGTDRPGLIGRTADGGKIELPMLEPPARLVEDPTRDGVIWGGGASLRRIRPYAPGGPVIDGDFLPRGSGIRDMLVDPEGVVWVLGSRALVRIDGTSVEVLGAENGFPFAGARAIHRSDDGTLWMGSYSSGIARFRDGEFGLVRAADGLWDDGASNILEDDAGNLWMGSNRGVHRVARAELDAFLDGEIERVHGRGYGPDAGFQNAETSGFHGSRGPDGRLWFPTFSGIAVIDPEEVLAREQVPPHIRIRAVSAGSEAFATDSVLRLPRGQRRVEIGYGATLLSGHGGLRYEVRLEGVDDDWTDAGSQRQVTYGSLPPGRHLFHARAISGAGVASLGEATAMLVVPPFFYETASFRLLMTLMALSALWFMYHLRVRQLRAREIKLERIVDKRTEELARSKGETESALATVEAQAQRLQSLDEAKSRFFANVSHELRTPLTLVQGPLQDVLDGRLGATTDAVREQVATVLASGKRLGELVEQLLDVARLESGEFRLHLRRQDLRPLYERLAQSFASLAKNRGIDFQSALPDEAISAYVDVDQIEKVFSNLLSNALKFTPAGGRVRFAVSVVAGSQSNDGGVVTTESGGNSRAARPPGQGRIRVTVEDDGPGIPAAEQARIFDRFQQVDDTSKRAHGGAGLGLALVKEVAELHGGTVDLWSEPGKGSRFTVSIPVDGPPAAAEAATAHAPAAAAEAASADAEVAGTVSVPSVGADELDDTERPTVLVVEDHAELRAYLRRHLDANYRVIEATNGREGLEAARRTTPDLVLCDIMMPEMDGDEMCRAIRADPELAYLPVIVVTAKASRDSRLSVLEGGADDYLVKPFDAEELKLRVRNALDSRRRFAERVLARGGTMPFVPLELPRAGPARDFATRLDTVLRENVGDEDFDVDGMASALAMSRATLYRKADEALGVTPKELLWSFRLDHAAHWLAETDGTVSEIAYATGFKTVPHFTRRFRERFGTTPAAYRNREEA